MSGMNNINEPWVGTKEIAEHLDVTKDTVHKWIKVESIPCSRVGKLWKFKKSEVDAWVKSGGAVDDKYLIETPEALSAK